MIGSSVRFQALVSLFALAPLAIPLGSARAETTERDAVVESARWYAEKTAVDAEAPVSPLGEPVPGRMDVRGMGDTAWTRGARPSTGLPTPPAARFAEAIARLDPSGALFRGDLSFVNWESVVGERCERIRTSADFYFLSHPDAIRQAVASGFNLFAFANNHARDCDLGKSDAGSASAVGPRMTALSLERIAAEAARPFAWAGVSADGSDPFTVRVVPFRVGNRDVRVAIGSVATFAWNISDTATVIPGEAKSERAKIDRLVARFREAPADFRVLSIHTQDASGNGRVEAEAFLSLKRIAERFVREGSGDVVFGEGPHTWGGVKVLPKADGRSAVIFTSLGNFIHAGLRSDPDNYVARALWDRDTLRLREVQVHPFVNRQSEISTYETFAKTHAPNANFEWSPVVSKADGRVVVGYSARFP